MRRDCPMCVASATRHALMSLSITLLSCMCVPLPAPPNGDATRDHDSGPNFDHGDAAVEVAAEVVATIDVLPADGRGDLTDATDPADNGPDSLAAMDSIWVDILTLDAPKDPTMDVDIEPLPDDSDDGSLSVDAADDVKEIATGGGEGDGYCVAVSDSASQETCNGFDDDCDGKTDEATCDDANGCTKDSCDANLGCVHEAIVANCDLDATMCTSDSCVDGQCVAGGAISCDDGNACTEQSCVATTGMCLTIALTGKPCSDGDACTSGDTCDKDGSCASASPKECEDGNPCTKNGCVASGGCTSEPIAVGCDDGNSCTTGDACAGVLCVGIPFGATLCDDNNDCTIDSCSSVNGCNYDDALNGVMCDDGNPCTCLDTCVAGTCKAGINNCKCAHNWDCAMKGNLCEGELYCDFSLLWNLPKYQCGTTECKIKPGTKVVCSDDDQDACTEPYCFPPTGKCMNLAVDCDDGDPCTVDSCDKDAGCFYNKATDAKCQ